MHLPTGNFNKIYLICAALLYLGFAEKGPCEVSRYRSIWTVYARFCNEMYLLKHIYNEITLNDAI